MSFLHVASLDALLPPTDKVYSKDGRFFKIRVVRETPPPGGQNFGMLVFTVSGSHCNNEAYALPHGAGHAIAPASRITVRADAPVDLAALLETARLEAALITERAVLLEEAAAAL